MEDITYNRPAPRVDVSNAAYWKAAFDSQLMLAECGVCSKLHHPPQAVCPFCWSSRIKPKFASGHGTVNSYSIVYQSGDPAFKHLVPYVLAYVDLEEGLSMVTNVVNCDINKVSIGMKIKSVFEQTSDKTGAVLFEPA
ncbi:MAG: OB-fold domain-containing protein [Georgfuchsia sp.]